MPNLQVSGPPSQSSTQVRTPSPLHDAWQERCLRIILHQSQQAKQGTTSLARNEVLGTQRHLKSLPANETDKTQEQSLKLGTKLRQEP